MNKKQEEKLAYNKNHADAKEHPKKSIKERINALEDWQKRKLLFWSLLIPLIGIIYLTATNISLYQDKKAEEMYWQNGLLDNEEVLKEAEEYSQDATIVTAGTYVENIREVNIKSSNYRIVFLCWFRWEGDPELDMIHNFRVYNGIVNKMEVLEDYHEGNTNYQQVRIDATIQKDYWIVRFPLESYQLRFYIEPNYSVERVLFEPDIEHSTVNPSLSISGFELKRHAVSKYTMKYASNLGNPEIGVPYAQELCTSMEINRSGFGLYVKCFIALLGTITWVFITLYLCAYHRVDPLGMIPAALFGTVTNIMVGANLLPDALQVGLLEYVTIGGIMVILACATSVVNINRIRNKYQNTEFAFIFGKIMFFSILTLTIAGMVLYPVCAYMF